MRLMIVEDHDGLRAASCRRILDRFPDVHLLEAESGEQAVALAMSERPHVILMDIGLPQMDGIEATRQIKFRLPEVYVAVVSVRDDSHSRARAREAGAATFIAKRDMARDLMKLLEAVIPELPKVCGASAGERP